MSSRKPKVQVKPYPRIASLRLMGRLARGALVAMSLQAAQIAVEEAISHRLFDRSLVDRLKEPLTRYHE